MPRFEVPSDEESPPSTPDRSSQKGYKMFHFGDEPSTTPAGPPPGSSTASFTPAGAPSDSFLGSSIMRGVPSNSHSLNSNRSSTNKDPSISRKLFPPQRTSNLGRSMQDSTRGRQPSRLSRQIVIDDDEDDAEGDDEVDEVEEAAVAQVLPQVFDVQYSAGHASDADGEADYDYEERMHNHADIDDDADDTRDMWLNMDQDEEGYQREFADASDLMAMATPAVQDRVRREAEDIYRASSMRSSGRARREMQFAPVAKGMYDQMGYAQVTESPLVIIEAESLVSRLYTEGIGSNDDAERLDSALASTSGELVSLWREYVESLPSSDEEHDVGIGPGPNATPFENAAYLASLVLQVHHTRFGEEGYAQQEPLTETMFRWLGDYHNLYPGQVQEVQHYRPGPACHSMFWQTIFVALLHGRVADAVDLLDAGGWDQVKRGGQPAYTGRALGNVERTIQEISETLQACPGHQGRWDIWSRDWYLFRLRAKNALERLQGLAEGRGQRELDFAESFRNRGSMTGMARKAESQVPWDIYENLSIVFDIILGSKERILAISQDWCEASIGLFGWWLEPGDEKRHQSRSQSVMLASHGGNGDSYLDRLARAFHTAVGSVFEVNSNNPIEVGMACVFEDNPKGVIGILRALSLPVATAVAEIASLGGWLPPHQPTSFNGLDLLGAEDLELLGVDNQGADDIDGIKDNTLVQYAQELVNYDDLASVEDRSGNKYEGWELAIRVLGRMESPQRSEETVGDLIKTIIDNVHADSGNTVEKVWSILNDLGMIAFAEETAEHYGETLAQESHRYGEAMWYYALAHRPSKVREVMNLLISYSLMHSTAYPAEDDLDDHLRRLLKERKTTIEDFAKQDLEAAELLGKMLSGYATLRNFYEVRDDDSLAMNRRKETAAAALAAVISSSDDNIRGGLYDASREAVVSEDFLLALLGEALVFVNSAPRPHITLDTIDILLKAVEDIQTVGGRVYSACDEFFQLVLKNSPSLKGSTPQDLLRSTSNVSGGSGSGSSSFVMTGSSMLVSQLHRSIGGSGMLAKANARRGWDWRKGLNAHNTAEDVLRIIRLGLSKDLAKLWIEQADNTAF